MEGGELLVALGALRRIDLQGPRHIRRASEQFLVEPVAPAADGLGQSDARRDGVGYRWQGHVVASRRDPRSQPAKCHRSPDTQATIPNA